MSGDITESMTAAEDSISPALHLRIVRRRRGGRPQRSEDRTSPPSKRSGRRPHLTRDRKSVV